MARGMTWHEIARCARPGAGLCIDPNQRLPEPGKAVLLLHAHGNITVGYLAVYARGNVGYLAGLGGPMFLSSTPMPPGTPPTHWCDCLPSEFKWTAK